MTTTLKLCQILLLSIVLSACSQSATDSKTTQMPEYSFLKRESGRASFYADKYQGRPTASGELFDQSARTAAHRTLPFGTWLKVINRKNGKSVMVRVNDRGPYIKGRIIDLSKSAFEAIANKRSGVINVTIEILKET